MINNQIKTLPVTYINKQNFARRYHIKVEKNKRASRKSQRVTSRSFLIFCFRRNSQV